MPFYFKGGETFKLGKLYCSIPAEKWKGKNNEEKEVTAKTFWLSYMQVFWLLPKPMMNRKEARHYAELEKAALLLSANPLTRDLGVKARVRLMVNMHRHITSEIAHEFGMKHKSRSPDTDLNVFINVSEILLQRLTALNISDRIEFIRSQLYALFRKMPTLAAVRMKLKRLSSDRQWYELIAVDSMETTLWYCRSVLPQEGDILEYMPSVGFLKELSQASHNFDNLLWRIIESAAIPPDPKDAVLEQYFTALGKYMIGNKQFSNLIKSIRSEQK